MYLEVKTNMNKEKNEFIRVLWSSALGGEVVWMRVVDEGKSKGNGTNGTTGINILMRMMSTVGDERLCTLRNAEQPDDDTETYSSVILYVQVCM